MNLNSFLFITLQFLIKLLAAAYKKSSFSMRLFKLKIFGKIVANILLIRTVLNYVIVMFVILFVINRTLNISNCTMAVKSCKS